MGRKGGGGGTAGGGKRKNNVTFHRVVPKFLQGLMHEADDPLAAKRGETLDDTAAEAATKDMNRLSDVLRRHTEEEKVKGNGNDVDVDVQPKKVVEIDSLTESTTSQHPETKEAPWARDAPRIGLARTLRGAVAKPSGGVGSGRATRERFAVRDRQKLSFGGDDDGSDDEDDDED